MADRLTAKGLFPAGERHACMHGSERHAGRQAWTRETCRQAGMGARRAGRQAWTRETCRQAGMEARGMQAGRGDCVERFPATRLRITAL